ncbi:HAMP domain-containing histidine kinase [Kribbella speibonae]|uniref:histidine kinase n=2 Tax=Kribbella speibonae TaxID=1572660 RepID=A0A4R0J9R7_9ACTN|nr:HAMP domain-containing histidine kinase [Kribbella speibonae]TCC42667.1 HAMP domain-containing histidine kinase [Kribbella speibonae]
MAAGVVLLGVTYALFNANLGQQYRVIVKGTYLSPSAGATRPPPPTNDVYVMNKDGAVLTGSDAERVLEQQREQVRQAAIKSLLTEGSIALLAVGALAAGFGWLVAGRVLAPLHRVTDTARRIAASPSALHERIALKGPDDEVKNLADAFDTMVERLDHSFDGQRRFVANASHELRTPLTLGRALVEVAMHRRTASPDVKELGDSLLTINARHEQLIDGLLILADSERHLSTVYPVNLADIVNHVAAQLATEAAAAGVELIRGPGEAPTRGDALLLERLVHNLVENGIRHNLPSGERWVQVRSRTAGDHVEIVVTNTGPEIPPYEVESLFKPFYRLGAERLVSTKGAGLGLSIVRSVTEAHSGTVTALPREGGGLEVTVTLPLDPTDAA